MMTLLMMGVESEISKSEGSLATIMDLVSVGREVISLHIRRWNVEGNNTYSHAMFVGNVRDPQSTTSNYFFSRAAEQAACQ